MEAIVKSRIDADLKTEVESVLAALGMTVSDVMRITFRQIVARQGLPFDVKLPNAQTLDSFKEADVALKRLRAGTAPSFNKIEDYFAVMDAKTGKPKAVSTARRTRAA